MKNIILHICCAPCAIYPVDLLAKLGFSVKGLFFNPNIHPLSEYYMRFLALKDYAKDESLDFEELPYDPKAFFNAIDKKENAPERCHICWRLRLKVAAKKAKDEGFDYFTSTLLVSPYQDTQVLEKIGKEEAAQAGVEFFSADFKSGFKRAHEQAKIKGIYCQKYCGCIYSEIERFKNKLQYTNSKSQTNYNSELPNIKAQ